MLHWLKVAFLIFLTLLIMRLLSWIPMWSLQKLKILSSRKFAFLCNVFALIMFVVFLQVQSMPGEPIDSAAIIFGVAVYLFFFIIDLYWLPWKCTSSL
jgi:hypothetical protein